jgi:hypothetical protein
MFAAVEFYSTREIQAPGAALDVAAAAAVPYSQPGMAVTVEAGEGIGKGFVIGHLLQSYCFLRNCFNVVAPLPIWLPLE